MEGGEQDKSEQPTPFRLQKARREGQVARGPDLAFFSGLAAAWVALSLFGPGLGAQLALRMRQSLTMATQLAPGDDALLQVSGLVLTAAVPAVALIAAFVFLTVLAFEVAQVGFVFSTKPLALDFNRLNPTGNLKRLVSVKLLVEAAKNVLKLVVYAAVAMLLIRDAAAVSGALTDAKSFSAAAVELGLRLIAGFILVAAGFAVLDQVIVRRDFLKRMRMSRRELRREHKDREGEPRLKRRRKELHAQFVKSSQSLRGLRSADVLVVNPTHVAVGLKYDARLHEAPIVVAQGALGLAERLKRLAVLHGVPIIAEPPLARMLLRTTLGREIPAELYTPVAGVYRRLRATNREATHA